jgi:hypothetical protein
LVTSITLVLVMNWFATILSLVTVPVHVIWLANHKIYMIHHLLMYWDIMVGARLTQFFMVLLTEEGFGIKVDRIRYTYVIMHF